MRVDFTMPGFDLYFWEPAISPHKIDLCNALAASDRVSSVTYIAQKELPRSRVEQGWSVGPLNAQLILSPDGSAVSDIVAASSATAVHIFSGIHGPPVVVEGLRAVVASGRRFGLLSEPRAFEGLAGWARLVHSWLSEGALRHHADFVLAIGRNGPPWFASVGYKRARIFPFAYFVPFAENAAQNFVGAPRVTFLGRLTRPKGINLFLEAIRRMRGDIHVEIAGGGPEEPAVQAASARRRNAPRYLGVLPMNRAPALLARTDILVAPSLTRDDGWGAAVGEALLQGAAVVATDRVGASICLDAPWRGRVVRRLDPEAIAGAIASLIESDELRPECRRRRADWAKRRLTGEAGAGHLLDILSHVYESGERPKAFYEG